MFLVEDFEDVYVNMTEFETSGTNVTMRGTITQPGLEMRNVGLFYDDAKNLSAQQLASLPYNGRYTSGDFVGAVVLEGWESRQGITITAAVWSQVGQEFTVSFDISPAFEHKVKGIYTIYLFASTDKALATCLIFF